MASAVLINLHVWSRQIDLHTQAEASAAAARADLHSVKGHAASVNAEHIKQQTAAREMQARLQDLYILLGGLPQQPPVQHRMLFQCFALKDPASLQALGLEAALDAIAGEVRAVYCNIGVSLR